MDFLATSVAFSSSPKLISVSPNAERGFCVECGSTLTMAYRADPATIALAIGSMDEDKSGKDVLKDVRLKHIYLEDVPSWYQVPDDGLERWETMKEAKTLLQYG